MDLKNNKGYTGVDISIAMIILMIFIPTVFAISYSIQKTSNEVKRKSEAISIATEILESAKGMSFENLESMEEEENISLLEEKYSKDVSFDINIEVENYYPEEVNEEDRMDLVKKIKITVTYPIGNKTKSIDISTVRSKT